MKVLLMANWGIGLEILKALDKSNRADVIKVITRFDRHSDNPWINCVHDYAIGSGYATLNEKDIGLDDITGILNAHEVNLLITHAFMKILPETVFSVPKNGSINIHPSLLPKYRGPAPGYWVLKNRESETGLTCHYIDNGIDTGDIIHQVRVPVYHSETIDSLIEKKKKKIPELISQSLRKIQTRGFVPAKQNEKEASYAPRVAAPHKIRM